MTRTSGRTRFVACALLALLASLGLMASVPSAAWADNGDEITSFRAAYVVGTDGAVQVKETIAYRFGSSNRHGIDRYLVTRERYDDNQDAVYTIDDVEVTSTTPGVSDQVSQRTDKTDSGRGALLRLRIGDPDETLGVRAATYEISYRVRGALRTSGSYDEFYWDVTGFDWEAPIASTAVSVTVPGGAQELSCFSGAVRSAQACTSKDIASGVGNFTQGSMPQGAGLTVGVKITPGLIADNKPQLEADGSKLSGTRLAAAIGAGILGLIVVIGSPIVGVLWWRKHGRDQRYAGLAPGTTPLAGQTAPIVASDPDITIPVAFSPPRIPVAEAGLLIDGQVDARETAATIIDLAVRGALTVQSSGDDDFQVTLVDPNKATAPHEMVLLTSLFGGRPPGAVANLSAQGSMTTAHKAMQTSVRNQVASRGWFTKVPSATAAGGVGFGAIAFAVFGVFAVGAWVLWILLPVLPILITWAVIRVKLRRGQRTADGRAVCDQVEGFKTYLATAEADQLRFEEGEDIFSRYLPWAIAFELADRWAKICGDLVAAGRLPDAVPYWYIGNYNMAAFNTSFIANSLTTAATPAPSSGASGTGFGGGSSFGGGGFSGGGGGGGGGGSW